ncbi:ATP-dependent helicase [Patescibacteria group bacterium]
MTNTELLTELNTEQADAVQHGEGPLLIVAGAGTGKTTVITRRIAWLIREGKAKPDEILTLTFTEKAAEEMEDRVDKLLPMGYVDLWTQTFHAFGERILRDHAIEIGLDPGFKVMSQGEQWLFIRQHLFDFDLDYYRPLGNPTRFIYALVSLFSRAKDENIRPKEYIKHAEELEVRAGKVEEGEEKDRAQEEAAKVKEVAYAYQTYEKLLRESGHLDFGDLITETLRLFRTRKTLLAKYREQFKYILVDEFQDTNFAQYELVRLLADADQNLTICGDDDQSIYKFRGASVSNILGFKQDYPDAREVVLTRNYRSAQSILDVAYSSIQLNNPDRLETRLSIDKRLVANDEEKVKPTITYYETEQEEAEGVAKKIVELKEQGNDLQWSDFAILVRSNGQAAQFTQILDRMKVPYQFVASKGLFSTPIIMDLVAYLRLLNNPLDSSSAFRVFASPFFDFDMVDIVTMQSIARRENRTMLDILEEIDSISGISDESKQSATKLLELLSEHATLAKTKSAGQILYRFVGDMGYIRTLLQEKDAESAKTILNISEFFKQVKDFEAASSDASLNNFLDELDMLQDAGEDPAPANFEEGPDMVHIMTIHSAKGLEFEHVFIVNLVDQRFPSRSRSEAILIPQDLIRENVPEKEAHIQEERRLFYVALTRAKKGLHLVAAHDYGGKRKKKPSVFLQEIEGLTSSVQSEPQDLLFQEEEEKEVEVPEAKLTLPAKLSFTQMAAFETCPRQYQYAHIFKIQPPGRHTYSYGQSLHKTLELFYRGLQDGKDPSLDDILELFEKCWISDWYDSKNHEAVQKKRGLETIKKYFVENEKKFAPPVFLEKDFNVKIGGATFKGKIDRIDRKEKGIEVVDYKTGKVKSQKDVDRDEQLSLYAIACKKVLKLEPEKLTLYFLDEGERVSTTRSDEELAVFEEKTEKLVKDVKESKFNPTPGFSCQFCDFLNICEEGLKQVGH